MRRAGPRSARRAAGRRRRGAVGKRRFHPEEEAQRSGISRRACAELGDVYVNDAFGTAHRAHASTEGIARDLPRCRLPHGSRTVARSTRLTNAPRQPFVCAIGGAKVEDKVGVFTNLLDRVEAFVIGGGMANTFLAAQGIDVGAIACAIRTRAGQGDRRARRRRESVTLHLPVDAVVAPSFDADDAAHARPDRRGRRPA